MLLVARTTSAEEAKARALPKAFGLTLFLVDTKAKGLTLTPLPMRGIEGYRQFTVHFDEVEVSERDVVGDVDGGAMAMFLTLNPERIFASAIACGMTDHLIQRSVEYALERKVFADRPIGAYQAIQHPLAECTIGLEAARLLTYRAAWAYDRGMPPNTVGFYANCAKHTAADLALKASDHAIQVHGGSGFSEEVGIVHLWEAARLLKTAPINREMILNYVAEHQLGLPRSY
jgi:alkylation response protein AidB-like acyl-CoA dehydrogenase